jgi:hypothetical protein
MKKSGSNNLSHRPSVYGAGLRVDNQIHRCTIHGNGTLTSTAGGVILQALSLDPNAYGVDYIDYNGTYDEFRVIGARLSLVSLTTTAVSANSTLMIAFDNDSAAAPASSTIVQQYSSSSVNSAIMTHTEGKPLIKEFWRPQSGGDTSIVWCDVAAPATSVGSIQIGVNGLTPATAYLNYAVELFCEFRGRR